MANFLERMANLERRAANPKQPELDINSGQIKTFLWGISTDGPSNESREAPVDRGYSLG